MCFGFADVFVTEERRRSCVICQKTLSAENLKPSKVKRHLEICHADLAQQTSRCFSSKTRWNKHKDVSQVKHTALLRNRFSLGIMMRVELLSAKESTKRERKKIHISRLDMVVNTLGESSSKQLSCIAFYFDIFSCRCGHVMSSKWAASWKHKKQTIWHSDQAADSDGGTNSKHVSGSFLEEHGKRRFKLI